MALRAEQDVIRPSGLFDADWYRAACPDIDWASADPLVQFAGIGWRQGRRPNPYFDPHWYLQQNQDVARAGVNALIHYIRWGEAEGRCPSELFDPAWYARQHSLSPGQTPLAHFLAHRCSGTVSPLAEFDVAFYLDRNPDVAASGTDPFEHYLLFGYREGRDPSADFDTRYYLRHHLYGDTTQNPLLHWRRYRDILPLHPKRPPGHTDTYAEIRRFTRPGPDFEEAVSLPATTPRRARLLAYYLPQFHPIAENDAWWGRGFTEWTSIGRAAPRFVGHYQPRIPRDLGHYSLTDPATRHRQVALARGAGIHGFVHYFYWFNGRRLLQRPLDDWLADTALDFPFCLMWANENWTRRWDGSDHQVLISQDYRADDECTLVDTLARHFRDPRYIRVDGRPLLMVYRAGLIPDTLATVTRWRDLFQRRHNERPVLVMAQSFTERDPRPYGFDAAVEFPPHKLVGGLRQHNASLRFLDPAADMQVFAYDEVVAASLAEPDAPFPLIKTAVPGWDNDARRQGGGLALHGSTPRAYQDWLAALVERARARPFMGEPFVAINAWNEWAEAAYLEPDVHYGSAYLNATARAMAGLAPAARNTRLLLVGHDAFAAGAQLLLLNLGRRLRSRFGVTLEFLLLASGPLAPDYTQTAPTTVLSAPADLVGAIDRCARQGFVAALVNTSASSAAVSLLEQAGIPTVLLVHEMPLLLREKNLLPGLASAAAAARRIVFPATVVGDRVAECVPIPPDRTEVIAQGCYHPVAFAPDVRSAWRATLRITPETPLILAAGYADLRKGFDLFLQLWRALDRRGIGAMCCWIGDCDPTLRLYLADEIAQALGSGRFLMPGHQSGVGDWLNAADVFALTSREDPLPSAALEALSCGLPVVAFDGTGGVADLLRAGADGAAVPLGDVAAMADAIARLAGRAPETRAAAARLGAAGPTFDDYAERLLALAWPDLRRVSVIIPSYNYARHLPERLRSIFAQTYPVTEIILVDDGSTDGSAALTADLARTAGRGVTVIHHATNTGSAFGRWREGVERARGDHVWIAEADDAAEPDLLRTLLARFDAAASVDLAFCDSRSIDAGGAPVWPDYQDYYAQCGASELARDGVFAARDFTRRFLAAHNLILNVSAVLWRRDRLLAALDRCCAELASWRVAGDWRLYLELLADSDGTVAYAAAALNVHRRHAGSVSGGASRRDHARETQCMHELARRRLGTDAALVTRQAEVLARLTASA